TSLAHATIESALPLGNRRKRQRSTDVRESKSGGDPRFRHALPREESRAEERRQHGYGLVAGDLSKYRGDRTNFPDISIEEVVAAEEHLDRRERDLAPAGGSDPMGAKSHLEIVIGHALRDELVRFAERKADEHRQCLTANPRVRILDRDRDDRCLLGLRD